MINGTEYFLHESNRYGKMQKDSITLLPPYDELLIGYKDRSAVLSKEHERKAYNTFGIFYPVVLHEHRIAGNWSRKELSVTFLKMISRMQRVWKRQKTIREICKYQPIKMTQQMKANLLSPDKDPMGAAITDYFHHQKAGKLRVFSSQFEEDEIPINQLFRSFDEMSEPEKTALQMASGKILDAGAGSGCHTLALQEMGKEVCAIDISPLSVKVMAERGVRDVRQINLLM